MTTNNRMELMAAISALESLTRPSSLTIVTDSAYVKNGITDWIAGWKRKGWRTAGGPPVKNAELWQRLDEAQARHQVTWRWIKGHAATPRMNAPTRWPGPAWRPSSRHDARACPSDP